MTTRVPLNMLGVAGCAANGTTDDTAAFTAAISGGGAVVLEPGKTYLLSSWTALTPSAPLTIIGNGATLKGPVAATTFLSPSSDFTFDGVVFDRWDSAATRLLAQSGTFTSPRVRGCAFLNFSGIPLNLERPVAQYWITDNRFEACAGGYSIKVGENTYANQDTYLKGVIRNNTFKTLSASGSTSCAAMLIYGREAHIDGNTIEGVQGASGEAWGIYTKVRYGTISHNRIRTVNSTSSSDVVGINVKGTPRSLTTSPQGFSVVVSGNSIFNVGAAGTKGTGIRVQTDDVLVIGNVTENTGLSGISTDDSNGSQNSLIQSNRIIQPGTATDYGIRLECVGSRVRALHNTVDGPVVGIYVAPPSGSNTDFEVSGNLINPTAAGIGISGSAFANLTYFRCTDNVVMRGANGIVFNAGAGSWTLGRVERNDLARATTKINGTPPTGVTADNLGYMEGSATYDPANLADGAGATTTVTCTGAALGDYASATFSLDLQGITLTAWVSAANTVSVRFQNESGGPLDLGSGTLKARAERR